MALAEETTSTPIRTLTMTLNTLLTGSFLVGLTFSTGCVLGDDTSAVNGSASGGEFDRDSCKIEGSDIGVEGLVVKLGRTSVTFDEWVSKDGESGEYVGFSISVSGAERVGYIVKAGGERYHSEDRTWQHPNGSGGSEAAAISHVDFCENDPGELDPNDPYCNDPDGCDNGSGELDPNDPYCNDPDGCDNDTGGACVDDAGCGANEFCNGHGVCIPYVE
jgi:hypothetical protein